MRRPLALVALALVFSTPPAAGEAPRRAGAPLAVPALEGAPAPKTTPPAAPALIERELTFPSASFSFPATLCLPAGAKGKLPVVILVHGTGAHDRDETLGPNKPFRDLAHGLAALGVATLRYDKRTNAFLAKINPSTLTLDEETIDDAVAALRFARTLPEIDPARVFVLGHSQGATFTPVIAAKGEARGAILMAALERPVDQVIVLATSFQARMAGKSAAEAEMEAEALRKTFARVRSGEAPDPEPVYQATARYWRSFLRYDPLAELKKLQAPVLLLYAGKDAQVWKVDYELARQAVAGKGPEMGEARWFPGLNHLFLPVEEGATGADILREGRVAPEVIEAIAGWVTKLGAAR